MKRLLRCGGLLLLLLAFLASTFVGNAAQKEGDEKKTEVKKEGDEKTFSVAEKAKVAVPGKEAGEISDLKVGDKVTVFFKEEAGKEVAHRIVHADAKPKKEKKEEPAK